MTVAARVKRIEGELNKRLPNKKQVDWPILGGLKVRTNPDDGIRSEPSRQVTLEEHEICRRKELVCPVFIAKSREQEWQEYLKQ